MTPVTKKPVIGITCGEVYNRIEPWWSVVIGQSQTYVQSVIDAGGVPLLLPVTDDEAVLTQLSGLLDGLYLAGGNDIHPKLYGQEPDSTTTDFSTVRDAGERLLLKLALASKKPILGICRGMQLLNIELGGTLHQDIAAAFPGALDHATSNKRKSAVDLSHTLRLQPGTELARIVGPETLGANAHHHQAIDQLGKGVVATAWAADDIIEAIELTDYPFAIGIQAHPESLTKVELRWQQLFDAFIAAARTTG